MSEMTVEEMEAQTKAIQEQLAARKAKQRSKTQKTSAPLAQIQKDTSVKNATLKNSHGGYAGKTLINKIEEQMDKRRKAMADMIVAHGGSARELEQYILQKGRYQGFAAALALLRSSSLAIETARSDERLGIE